MEFPRVQFFFKILCLLALAVFASTAHAQRADENVITSAEDAFGTAVSGESIGLYDAYAIRGFSPSLAGNLRIEGLYFDQQADMTIRAQSGYSVHVGTSAQGYIFPAPTGIVDYTLRRSDDKFVLSAVSIFDSNRSARLEFDGQLPLIDDSLSTAIGASISRNKFISGNSDRRKAFGLVPRWHSSNVEVTAFWGRYYTMDETAAPIYLPADDIALPPEVRRHQYPGPFWATGNGIGDNTGILGLASMGNWTLRAGLFHSLRRSSSSYANLFVDVNANATGDHIVFADPPQRAASTSGEVRLSRSFTHGDIKQLFLGSLRWRNVGARYGGSDNYDAGVVSLNDQLLVARPQFNFGEQSSEHVTQQTVGFAYNLHWEKIGDLGFGLQHADYFRRDAQPGLTATRINSSPWLQNLTTSLNLSPTLTAYGSYSRGLEDNGNAPDSTVNRGQPLPAIKSRQYDVGLSWSPSLETKLIVGYFNIKKPYVAADKDNLYRLLGDEIHSGLELSLNASPLKGLTMILGGVFADPHIDHVSDANEVIGKLPVSQPRNIVQLNLDYVLPFAPQASINLSINEFSSFASTVDNRFYNGYPTIVNAGGRYKFRMHATPYTLRFMIANATNQYFWYQAGTHAFQPSHDATTTLSLAADF